MLPSDYPDMDKLCNEVLTTIELEELKLLNWGFVDVRSPLNDTLPDLLEMLAEPGASLWQDAQVWGISLDDILRNLLDRRLLFRQSLHGQYYYRSRFAETIRLLALLRQRFSHDDWQTANRLVSDFKIEVKRRVYPRRDVSFDEVRVELRKRRADPFYIEAVANLLQDQNGRELPLARFQKQALLQQYDALHSTESSGLRERALVIGAGTGAGKTKAFYIPAMAEIASTLSRDHYVKAMAIYPRVELLKDQFIEAFQEARKLDSLLGDHGRRKVVLGAYYQDTPMSVGLIGKSNWKFSAEHDGWECPFFSCPGIAHQHANQRYPLIWQKKDVEEEAKKLDGGHAVLKCPSCSFTISSEQLLLTREQMLKTPPDILFTTTEMLNRNLSKTSEHHLFGCVLETNPPPSLLLLDEIHTHEGLQGAQIAYLLRRWRYSRRLSSQAGTPLCCVGLSATLTEADSFFAKLTGISKNRVHYIHPEEQDLEAHGAEYNVMLKSDPVAATNPLSTSVQTVMLLARMLDPHQYEPSHGAYGRKIFAFTDKLDVINRWYHIELDVERTDRDRPLSKFRRVPDNDALQSRKAQAGQNWSSVCEQYLGHNLTRPLKIDRTSSQDRGVDSKAQVVIATSTLEVGYNDDTVGAVVQHKAPHSLASFLQRKGRAGRKPQMRPWMVVVTSEYGRDRWAFQHAENLFSPTLKTIDLPIENYYVRKMQATFAFMDWLALELKQDFRWVNMWNMLSGEKAEDFSRGNSDAYQRQNRALCRIIRDVLTHETRREVFAQYLRRALDIREQRELDALLWDEPRSLLFEVLPTVLRQLESNWRSMSANPPKDWADAVSKNPLIDFVTPNLFSDLQSFDIPIYVPLSPPPSRGPRTQRPPEDPERKEETLSLSQSLVEFAPGNVNKRYASSRSGQEAHWVPIPEGDFIQRGVLPLEQLAASIVCDKFPDQFTIEGQTYQFYTPRSYTLSQLPEGINNSSNAHLLWKSHFEGTTFGSHQEGEAQGIEVIHLARHSRWNRFLTEIRSYTQANGSSVKVARLATGLQAETRYTERLPVRRLWLEFEAETAGRSAGIGFINYVDALRFRLRPFDLAGCLTLPQWPEILNALRPEYFRYRLRTHRLAHAAQLSHFEREWLWQLELSMLASKAVEKQCSLAEAAQEVRQYRAALANETMKTIFQAQQAEDSGEESAGRLHEKLRRLIESSDIQLLLDDCAPVLWEQADEAFYGWLQQCYASSLGAALFTTLTRLAPEIDPDDLHMDLDGDTIWISEAVPGGIGIISKIAEIIKARPYEFDLQMQDTLSFCDRQQLGDQLQAVAEQISQGDQELAHLFTNLRQEYAVAAQQTALSQIKHALEQRGIAATRDFIVVLLAKFLRPNSAQDSDQLIAALADFWRQEEQRLHCTFDLRIAAIAAIANTAIESQASAVLQRINGGGAPKRSQLFNILQSILWFSCTMSCPDCIEERHPFQELAKPSRHLILALLQAGEHTVAYGQQGWFEQVKRDLETTYRVRILCAQEHLLDCKQYLLRLLVEPVDVGFQFFYPLIERITRSGKMWTIDMRIRELANISDPIEAHVQTPFSAPPREGAVAVPSIYPNRVIKSSARGSSVQLADCLGSLFALELLKPAEELFLISPWLSEVSLVDNRFGQFRAVVSDLDKAELHLGHIFTLLAERGTRVHILYCTPVSEPTSSFLGSLQNIEGIECRAYPDLHEKGLSTSHFHLRGSMNFTYKGVKINGESVELTTEESMLWRALQEGKMRWEEQR